MSSEEEALLKRARAGDTEPLFKAWEPRIYRFGLRMCGDEDSAREVLQETLLARHAGWSISPPANAAISSLSSGHALAPPPGSSTARSRSRSSLRAR